MIGEEFWIAAGVAGGLVLYFIRLESKLAKIATDLEWLKKSLDRRKRRRED